MHAIARIDHKRFIIFPVLLCLWVGVPSLLFAACAGTNGSSALDVLQMPWPPGAEQYETVLGTYTLFTGKEMKDAYEFSFGVIPYLTWMSESKWSWRIGAGFTIGDGEPLFPDPSWTVRSSTLTMFIFPAETAVLYHFTDSPREKTIAPYAGIGFGGFFGFERISVEITRAPEGTFQWNDTRFRYVMDGHALAGATIRITDRFRALIEVRWTQSGKGSTIENSFSEAEIAEGWLAVEQAVQRPDFDFTGLAISFGLQW